MRFPTGRIWSLAVVGGLVLLNVVLIGLLVLRPGAPAPSEVDPVASPSVTPTTGEELEKTSPSPVPTATNEVPEEAAPPAARPAERLLVNVNDLIAWRGTVGSCAEPGTLEHTSDGGQTWSELPMDLAPLHRLRVLGTETLFAIGGDEDCAPTYISSFSSGASWSTNEDFLSGSWYLHPEDRDVVATPVGDVDVPCEAVDLAGADATNAAILCVTGELAVTSDGGASWQDVDVDGDALVIGITDGGYVLAGQAETCEDGVAVTTLDLAGTSVAETCVGVSTEDATELAVSGAGGATWLWAGDEVLVSS